MKICTKCGVGKDETEFHFVNKTLGLRRPDCKSCRLKNQRKYRKSNRDKILERNREYYKSNREKKREYYKANRDKILEKKREYREDNLDKIRETKEEHYKANRDKILEKKREYYKANRDKILKRQRKYCKENPDKVRERNRRRRARMANCDGSNFTEEDVRVLLQKQHGKCIVCKTSITIDTLHRDHRVPLAAGGDNSRDNLQLLCAPCNLSKHAKDPIDFAQQRGFLIL